jgi:Type 9 secretion system plug protein 1st domain
MTLTFKSFLVFFLFSTITFSQVEEVNPPEYIKTITFKSNTNQSQLPILKLNDRLQLEFDVLNGDEPDFYYVIEYYNFDWTPNTTLLKSEYLHGFDDVRITDYENSFNTYQIYSHYRIQIPNQQTRLKLSGNYMITIYNDYEELMFSRKFMVYEDSANVGVSIKRSRDVRYVQQKQSVDINVSSPSMYFNNPNQTIKVAVIQNNNLNTSITNLKPQYTIGRQLIYKYDTESSFWGGNEFLYFENKNVRGANVGVQFIDLKDIYHNYLFTDIVRAERPYTYNPDINGNFLITALDTDNVAIEADYTVIHFSIQHPELFNNKSIYVYGNFNNYAIDETTKMSFNAKSGYYETTLKLKQGFYNYKYIIVDENGNLEEGAISGNFDQTENNYKVLVYYRDLGARYDKIIGFGEGSSVNISN